MSTVRQLLEGSLKLIGVLSQGENVSGEEAVDGLSRLNEMIDSMSTDGLMIYQTTREAFAVGDGADSRTMGPTGDFETTRPIIIQNASMLSQGVELPIKIYNSQQWQRIAQKENQSDMADGIYVEDTYPNKTIYVYPVPSSNYNLVLYSLKPLTQFTSLNETVSLPPGYAKMLRYNLAVELSPEYGVQIDPIILKIAEESKASVKRLNTKPVYLRSDVEGLNPKSRFNILKGDYE